MHSSHMTNPSQKSILIIEIESLYVKLPPQLPRADGILPSCPKIHSAHAPNALIKELREPPSERLC